MDVHIHAQVRNIPTVPLGLEVKTDERIFFAVLTSNKIRKNVTPCFVPLSSQV